MAFIENEKGFRAMLAEQYVSFGAIEQLKEHGYRLCESNEEVEEIGVATSIDDRSASPLDRTNDRERQRPART